VSQVSGDVPPVGAILSGPHWPDRVRVMHVEPRGRSRLLIEAVTLDGRFRLISRLLNRDDLAGLEVAAEADRPALTGDPTGFRLAVEATRMRLAYTHDPQFAVSVARIDPLPHQLEAVYDCMLHQPRLRFLLADDPGAGKTIMAGLLLKELKLRRAITRSQGKLMAYAQRASQGADMGLSIQEERGHLEDLRRRQARRLAEAGHAGLLALSAPEVLGVAAVVPAATAAVVPGGAGEPPMRRSDAVEAAAMARATAYERARGWEVEDVSPEARGYDLLSRGPNGEVHYVEVKGRAGEGVVELSANEWLKAEQLGADYWLYIVADALQAPALYVVQDPAHRLPREEVVPQVRYRVGQQGWKQVAESAAGYRHASEQRE
jgi:hypothetical protein